MRPGDDIYDEVDKGIREHEKILLCASEHSALEVVGSTPRLTQPLPKNGN